MTRVLRHAAAVVLVLVLLPVEPHLSHASDAAEHIAVDLAEMAWLEGRWQADAFGGRIEEVWLPAMGNSMQAVFRAVSEESLQFSEFIQVTAEEAGIIMRFNHFRSDYSTWEGSGPPMELVLKSASSSEIVFEAHNEASPDRIVYRMVEDQLHVTVTGLDGVFVFHRAE